MTLRTGSKKDRLTVKGLRSTEKTKSAVEGVKIGVRLMVNGLWKNTKSDIAGKIHGPWTMDHGLEGFTLVEVMVATMILALGAALIYESFFRSADAHGYAQAYFSVSPWLEEKIWRTQDSIERYGTSAPIATEGKASIGNKEYEWEMTYGLAGENDEQQIYDIELILFLQYGENVRELSRYASAIYEKEQNE